MSPCAQAVTFDRVEGRGGTLQGRACLQTRIFMSSGVRAARTAPRMMAVCLLCVQSTRRAEEAAKSWDPHKDEKVEVRDL